MKRPASLLAAVLLMLSTAACGSGGGINLPTNLPTTIPTGIPTTIPTGIPTTIPTITLPTVPGVTTTSPTEQQGTVTVTQTSRPTTATVTSTVTTAPQPASTTSDIPLWVWVVLALLLLALLVLLTWLVRRSPARRTWDDRMAAARRNARWVDEVLIPQVLSRSTSEEAAAAWSAAHAQILTLDEMLYSLSTEAPDPDRGTDAATLRARIRNLANAMAVETSTAQDASVEDLRDRQAAVWRARTELRQFLDAANALH